MVYQSTGEMGFLLKAGWGRALRGIAEQSASTRAYTLLVQRRGRPCLPSEVTAKLAVSMRFDARRCPKLNFYESRSRQIRSLRRYVVE